MTDLINEVIDSYNEYLKKVPVGCQKISDDLRNNQISVSLKGIVDFTDGIKWLSEASELLEKNGVSVNLNTQEINQFLEEINHGLIIQDYILVADMFEYEIQPFFAKSLAIRTTGLQ